MKLDRKYGQHLPVGIKWIHFVMTNNDILMRLTRAPMRIRKVEEGLYKGRIFGTRIEIEEQKAELSQGRGQVLYLTEVVLPLGLGATYAKATHHYYAIDENLTSIDLILKLRTRGLSTIYAWLLMPRVKAYLDRVCDDIGLAARLVAENDPQLEDDLDEAQRQRVEVFRETRTIKKAEEPQEQPVLTANFDISLIQETMLIEAEAVLPDRELLTAAAQIPMMAEARQTLENAAKRLAACNNPALITRGAPEMAPRENVPFQEIAYEFGYNLYHQFCTRDLTHIMPVVIHHGARSMLRLEINEDLEELPWEALHDGHDYLSMKVRFARSLAAVSDISGQFLSGQIEGILLVGADSEGDLPGVEYEVKQIAEILQKAGVKGIEVLCGLEATRKHVLDRLQSGAFRALHFSGHSVFDGFHPHQSYLKLTRGTRLNLHDLRLLSQSRTASGGLQLVFLNSCESGRIGLDQVSGRNQSLCRMLRESGVPNVVGMLWKVLDDAAVQVATHFYRSMLIEGVDAPEAMRRTRQAVALERAWADGSWLSPILYV